MRILYVHGFGAESGGALEGSLAQTCARRGVDLDVIRWPSGDLHTLVRQRIIESAIAFAAHRNSPRSLTRSINEVRKDAARSWESAKQATEIGATELLRHLKRAERSGEEFSILGFSLGSRVVQKALAATSNTPDNLCSIVIAGGAIATRHFPQVSPSHRSRLRLVNVYSRSDEVLRSLYPLMEGVERLAGLEPLGRDDVEDVEFDCGHSGYGSRVEALLNVVLSGKRIGLRDTSRVEQEIELQVRGDDQEWVPAECDSPRQRLHRPTPAWAGYLAEHQRNGLLHGRLPWSRAA